MRLWLVTQILQKSVFGVKLRFIPMNTTRSSSSHIWLSDDVQEFFSFLYKSQQGRYRIFLEQLQIAPC